MVGTPEAASARTFEEPGFRPGSSSMKPAPFSSRPKRGAPFRRMLRNRDFSRRPWHLMAGRRYWIVYSVHAGRVLREGFFPACNRPEIEEKVSGTLVR